MLLPSQEYRLESGSLNLNELKKLLNKDDPLILEIGANIGQSTQEFLEVFPNARIFCFEPEPRAIAKFKRNITASNVTLFEHAIGRENGMVSFHQSDGEGQYKDWDQSGSIRAPKLHTQAWPDLRFESRIEVPIMRLDDWAEQNGIGKVDFIWADVQGAESDLIAGGARTLSSTTYFYTEYGAMEWYEGQVTLDDICRLVFGSNLVLYRKFDDDALFVNKTHVDLRSLHSPCMPHAFTEVESFAGLADYLEGQVPPKADAGDILGRMRDVVSDPINALITRHPWAGQMLHDDVVLHNGVIVPYTGKHSYYGEHSRVLIINRGVHEPLEEFCFQEMLKHLPDEPVMLELGAYWGHYSMWCQKVHPKAQLFLVEPEMPNLECAINNFKRNGFSGVMIQDLVGDGRFQVDEFVERKALAKLHVLHSDIQGFEAQMLRGAQNTLASRKIDYIFISTHSDEVHEDCISILESLGYVVTVQSNFSTGTTSYDGFILACSPDIKPLLAGFKFLERVDILHAAAKK